MTTKSICGAATKALLLWILFYVLLLHGFVAWKWYSVSITIDQHPSVWDNNNNIMNSGMKSGNGVAAIKAAKQEANKEKQRLERRATRKDQLRALQQAVRQQERAAKRQQARNERKEAFLQRARRVRAEERAKRLHEKRSAAVEAALQERQVQRIIRKEQALQRIAENKAARKAAYEQALAERQAARAVAKKARQLERLETARIAILAERTAKKEAARAAAAHKRANSTIQQVQEEEQLRTAIHVQEAFIDKQESYIRAISHRLHRVSEARTRIIRVVQQDDNNPKEEESRQRRRLDLELALQEKINQVAMAITHPDDILSSSLSLSKTGGAGYSAPHQLDPLVVWLQKQVQVEEVVVEENDEEEEMTTARTINKNSSDLLLLHPTLDDLLQQFEYIDSVLQHQINQAASVNWTQIHELLQNEYPFKEISSSRSALYCSNAHEAAVLAKMEHESSSTANGQRRQELILSASNLAQRLDAAVNMHNYTTLDHDLVDHHHVPIYFAETYDNIYAKLNEAMEAWLQRVAVAFHEYEANVLVGKKDASSTAVSTEVDESGGGGGGGCVSMDQVHELLRDGLDALNRNQDLRQALLYSMSRLDMNASSIILDAMLPGDDNDMQKLRNGYDDDDESDTTTSSSVTRRRSLRELLDQPVTQEVANWVNLVLDAISGHFDGMDRFLDETIPAGVDVGEYVVNRLLELAGTFGGRNVMARIGRILPKKIKQSLI